MEINETFNSNTSINNLEIIVEDSEISFKVQQWANQSGAGILSSMKTRIRQIIVRIKQLFGIRTYDKGKGNVKMLNDIAAFNKLASFIAGSRTYKVALFGPNNVASYSKNVNFMNARMGSGDKKAKELTELYSGIKNEMNSSKVKMIRQAASETRTVTIRNERDFKAILLPFIRNMLVATKKLNKLAFKMFKSFQNLVSHMSTINRKTKMDRSSAHVGHIKNDLSCRCLNYVAYANKILVTTCEKAIERMDNILESYYNMFGNNN